MPLLRRVEPELLDVLPPHHAGAIGSRRDLRRINGWMGQRRIMLRLLEAYGPTPPQSILELGSGDGTFMLSVARRLAPAWPRVTVRLLDRQDVVAAETRDAFAALGWTAETVIADAFDTTHDPFRCSVDVVTANLFLHHFEPTVLSDLLARIARSASYVVACEPRRSGFALGGSRMIFAIGCNAVSRHDAVVSVRAGFRDGELSGLWPCADAAGGGWHLQEGSAGLFSHTFVARRDDRA